MTTTTIPTAEPGVRLVKSRTSVGYHVITNYGTPFVLCTTCKAAEHGRDCWAATAALEESLNAPTEETMTQETTTAVAIAEKREVVIRQNAYQMAAKAALGGWNDLVQLGGYHIDSGFAPPDVKKPEQAAMILLKALELDIPITSAYEFVAVIKGRPKLMGQMVGALVARSGKGTITIIESSNERAVAEGRRDGRAIRITFTIQDANKAGLHSDVWKAYPADMLRHKAITRVGRFMFPDVLGGMDVVGTSNEILDTIDVTTPEGAPAEHVEIIPGDYRVIDPEPVPTAGEEGTGQPLRAAADTSPAPEHTNGHAPQDNEILSLIAEFGLNLGDMARHLGRGIGPKDADEVISAYAKSKGLPVIEVVKAAALAKETNGGSK